MNRRAWGLWCFLSACSGTQTTGPAPLEPTPHNYFPLRAGAAWSFESTEIDRPGPSSLVVLRVVRADSAGGFYVSQGRGVPAVYAYDNRGVTRNGELILRGPLTEGTRWRGASGDVYVLQRVGLSRTVPSGRYNNVIEVVRMAGAATLNDGTEYRETYWYALGVGPIEAELPILVAPGQVRRFHLVLRGYTLDGEL